MTDQRFLRYATIGFAVAFAIHGADHARRGTDVVTEQIMWAGNTQAVLAVITIGMILFRHRWAPHAAILLGLASAIGFTAAHLLPTWSVFSDSFLTPEGDTGVTWFSWLTAVGEITAALTLAYAGLLFLRRTPHPDVVET